MTNIDNTTVLSVFNIIKNAIIDNNTLTTKFNASNILQFEPKHKSASFKGFPYFWINFPESEPEKIVFDNNFTIRSFDVPVILRVDYQARSRVLDYANAFLKAIEDDELVFDNSGYYDVMPSIIDTNPDQQIEEKEVVEVEFNIALRGQVSRS